MRFEDVKRIALYYKASGDAPSAPARSGRSWRRNTAALAVRRRTVCRTGRRLGSQRRLRACGRRKTGPETGW